ncbi:molybdopterin-guanine dinucleotide biosynthesis protein B [Paenibacillus anaericanus]|uniref:molybdopterin-guanine dinucleotide biosynthesis protein B n=1 Tax=Paenibacillus anaericanus TaxID=170367 RepID=UPI002786B173|nr:molybdopterin-guanine dinucleotide biosynthesis protein B [Paenibacillus anaericanus]MDQ0091449.1 molybdopterin-guanine dinucleotide biosynthesis protein B [Paenibacillus anaericanus]
MSVNSTCVSIISDLPVLQIVGYKNSGKTTLTCKLIATLTSAGLRVGSAKHDAHRFQLDEPGTDSSKHLTHGAVETVLTSNTATRWMRQEPTSLQEIAALLNGRVDILIAEGFKAASYPKIALIRESNHMIDLLKETSDIRLWVSWLNPKKFSANSVSNKQIHNAPILSIHEEDILLDHIQTLIMSLLPPDKSK